MTHPSVDLCRECERFVRTEETTCPFCGAPHQGELPPRTALRSRLVHVIGAALLLGACGSGEAATEESGGGGEGSGGGEVVSDRTPPPPDGEGADGEGPDGERVELEDIREGELSCAGTCGSHHHPACMDEDPPCPAPPYGAPPAEDLLV